MSLLRRAAAAALLVAIAFGCLGFAAAAQSAAPPACGGRDIAAGLDLAAARAARADELADGQGLLWRVERDGIAPSYLFGTIHSTDDGATAIARRAAAVAAKATVVATELGGPFDAVDRGALSAKLLAGAIDRDDDTFLPDLAGAAGAPVEALVAAHGVPKEMAHHLKLWFLAASVEAPLCEQAREQAALPEVDEIVAEAGAAAKIPVVGLETADEQLAALAAAPPALAAALLKTSARVPKLDDDAYATMVRLYRDGRPAEMIAVVDALPELTAEERAAERAFDDLLLIGRNATMAERAAPLVAKGGAFVAVGALHLPGKGGLIARFRAMGYRVVNVW
jgi:uncharacterized protein YbaP (TraB family)